MPNPDALKLFRNGDLAVDPYAWVKEMDENLYPALTSIDGVFAAGSSSAGPPQPVQPMNGSVRSRKKSSKSGERRIATMVVPLRKERARQAPGNALSLL